MLLLWYADRATGISAYMLLVVSVFTGIAYNAKAFGAVHRFAQATHTPLSWAAVALLLLHGGLGAVDALLVVNGSTPPPGYGLPFLVAGAAMGLGALILVVVATIAFVDPKRIERPWKPGVVHAFAYGGFAFATIHAAAVGTDVREFALQGIAAIGVLLALAVLFRRRKANPDAAAAKMQPGSTRAADVRVR